MHIIQIFIKGGKCMFFKTLLQKMKSLVVFRYHTDEFFDNLRITFDENTDFLKTMNNVSDSKYSDQIDVKEIYKNRAI